MNQKIHFEEDKKTSPLNRKQVAERLGIHFNTVRRLEKSGELASIRIGPRLIRYTEEAVQGYIDSQTWNWP